MSEIAESGVGTDFWPSLLDPALDAIPVVSQDGGDALLSAPPSLSEANFEDDHGELTQAGSTPSDEGETVNNPDVGAAAPDQGVLASLSTYTAVEIAPAADITDATPADGGVAQVSGVVEYAVLGGGFDDSSAADMLAGSDVVVAAAQDEGSPAAAESAAPMAPAVAFAISDGTGFDGAMGASLVYDGCWCDPMDGSADGDRIYYGDGSGDGWFTKPYVIGDVIEEVPSDDTLPAEGEDGFPVDEEGDGAYVDTGDDGAYVDEGDDWTYVDEGDEWVYVDEGEDWTYVDEGDDGTHVDEGEDWSYLDESGDWIYVDESGEWIYVGQEDDSTYIDNVDDGIYVDEGDDWTYADGTGDPVYVAGDADIVVCWGYPVLSSDGTIDEPTANDGDAASLEGGDDLIAVDDATLTATLQPVTADSDLFIAA